MKLYVLFAQRIESYPGEYGPEALACMTDYEYDDNPIYLTEQTAKYAATKEFERLEIIKLAVDEQAIMQILRPTTQLVAATVLP